MSRYPQPGTVLLGKYRVDSLIGEGGMGAVIKARHLDLDDEVAIKVLLPEMMERPEIVQRFLREARAAVKLKGEHVARVLDVGRLEAEFAGVPYIVMEYLDGADLNAIIRHHGPQDPAVAVDLMLQACEAIAEAHAMGIIHRDIKASNFFITQPEGQAPHLKVLDFGIATTPSGISELTTTQSIIGTPAYMAPEQMRTSRSADARSDVWSMGVVLYELLEGARPFRSDVYSDLCLKVGMDPPIRMEQPDIPEALTAVVMKCLEKSMERRYQSVAELAFDLLPFATDPVLARASIEQCARLLGRRGLRSFDAARAPDDVTPPPMTPARLTPTNAPYPIVDEVTTPAGVSRRSGMLTPVPATSDKKTPTSINSSNGEVAAQASSASLRPRRRGILLGSSVLGVGVLVVGVWLVARGSGGSSDDPRPAAAVQSITRPDPPALPAPPPPVVTPPPAPPPEPITVVVPVPIPVQVAAPTIPDPVPKKPHAPSVKAPPVAKPPPPKKDPKKVEPPPPGGDDYTRRQ